MCAPAAGGGDVWVQVNRASPPGVVEAMDLATGAATRLFDLPPASDDTQVQVSGAAVRVPGWAILPSGGCGDPTRWTCNKVMAVDVASAAVVHRTHSQFAGL